MSVFVQSTEILLGEKIKVFFDDKAKSDCYTVVYVTDRRRAADSNNYVYGSIGMNANPFHPSFGICQHSEAMLGKHLGKRISFMDLPEDCQVVVIREITAMKKEAGK